MSTLIDPCRGNHDGDHDGAEPPQKECSWRTCGSDCVTVTACECGQHVGHIMPMGGDHLGPDRLPICAECHHCMTSHETQRLNAYCTLVGCSCQAYVRPSGRSV